MKDPDNSDDGYYYVPLGEEKEQPSAGWYCIGTNFTHLRTTENGRWALIRHRPTKEEKWVFVTFLRVKEDVSVAFYDADPTFLPEGEKP